MRTLQTLLALVGGLALGAGATVGTVMLVNRHRTGKPTLILGKENLSGIACMQDLVLEKVDMDNFSTCFRNERGNAKDLAPEILSARCKDVIKLNDKALEKFDLLSNLKELMPVFFDCINLKKSTFVKQNVSCTLTVLNTKDILELDTSDVDSMSDIGIFFIDFLFGEKEHEATKPTRPGERRLLSNSEKAVVIRYLQVKFLNTLGGV